MSYVRIVSWSSNLGFGGPENWVSVVSYQSVIDQAHPYPAIEYHRPMSARLARHEARNTRRLNVRLPKGHPYRMLPVWIPYPLARALAFLGL